MPSQPVPAPHESSPPDAPRTERRHSGARAVDLESLASTLERITDAFFAVDRDWRMTYVNERSAALMRRPAEALLGRSLWDIFPDAIGSEFDRQYRLAMRTQQPVAFESYLSSLDLWAEVRAYPSTDGLSVFYTDVGDRKRAELAREQREADLRLALDAGGLASWEWNVLGDRSTFSPQYEAMLGLAPGSLDGRMQTWLDIVHPDDRAAVHAVIEAVSTGRDDRFRLAHRVVRRDTGEVRWTESVGRVVRDGRGRAARVVGMTADVTEQRRAEQRFRALAETMPQLVWSTGADGAHDYFNERWYEYTGMPREGDRRSMSRSFLHPDDYERTYELWRRSLETGEPFEIEYRLREAATGRYRWFIGRAIALRDENGAILRWFGTCTDIDEMVRAREATRRLQALAAALSEATSADAVADAIVREGLSALDAWAGVLALLTPDGEALEILRARGYPPEACMHEGKRWPAAAPMPIAEATRTGTAVFVGSPDQWRERYPGAYVPTSSTSRAWAAVPLAVAGPGRGAFLWTFDRPREFSEEERAFLGAVARLCAQALDRARLYEAERRAREDAERASRAKLEFLTAMSHELRTPLNAIGGYAELIDLGVHGPVTGEQRDALDRLRRSQRHLLGIINDLLQFGRIEQGRIEYALTDVLVADALEAVEALVAPQLGARGLDYERQPCPPGLRVRADADRLAQVLLNLLTNAIKFTAPGGRVVVSCERRDGRVHMRVRDTGRGIPPDRLDAIFDPFVQVDQRLTRENDGVGLGLAISRDLARGMGGELTAESELGEGSTFTLTLPAVEPGEPGEPDGPGGPAEPGPA